MFSGRFRKSKREEEMEATSLLGNMMGQSDDEVKRQLFTLVGWEYAVLNRGAYYPCEVGVIQFSLTEGERERPVKGDFHTFICPKPLPMGTFAEAKQRSEETHQIPILGEFPHWNTDFQGIAEKIRSLIDGSDRIFVKGVGDRMKAAAGCLEYLIGKSNTTLGSVSIMKAETLLNVLSNRFNLSMASPDEITKYLQRPFHDFDTGARCRYHEEMDGLHCAYGTVSRMLLNFLEFFLERGVRFAEPISPQMTPESNVNQPISETRRGIVNHDDNSARARDPEPVNWNVKSRGPVSAREDWNVVAQPETDFTNSVANHYDDAASTRSSMPVNWNLNSRGPVSARRDWNGGAQNTSAILISHNTPVTRSPTELYLTDGTPLSPTFTNEDVMNSDALRGDGNVFNYPGPFTRGHSSAGYRAMVLGELENDYEFPPPPPSLRLPKTMYGITVEPTREGGLRVPWPKTFHGITVEPPPERPRRYTDYQDRYYR